MALESVVNDLLLRWEERPALTPEELCRDYAGHAEQAALIEAVRRGIHELQALAGFLAPSPPEADPAQATRLDSTPAAVPPPAEAAPAAGPRYRQLSRHAQGGLGEVWKAQDEELHREVALKRIRGEYRRDAESRRSFLREAEITAKLEHPGVVPVHGLVQDADGQPCYAMRFIRGTTLQDAIEQFHAADRQPRREPGERSLALRDLLNRFIAVCNTIAYAHSRGVLHRDLKPTNVMLGPYGETLVVDWGLAKPFAREEAERAGDEDTLIPRTDGGAGTQPGQVKGTPAYMSPEQAAGRWDVVGAASDIYSLGAMLYTMLTGQPPVRGPDVFAMLEQAKRGEVAPPRQVKPGVPKALEAVCLRALAREPEERYARSLDLAADVERWLADEPVSACRDPLTVRLARWGRRHRTAVTAATVLLLAALVALSASLMAVNAEKNRTAAAEQETRAALARVTEEQGKTAEALDRSQKAERSAAAQRQLALRTVRDVVGDVKAQLRGWPGQKELRKALLARTLAGLREVARAADTGAAIDHETIWVHFELGDIFLEIEEGGSAEAKKEYEKAHELARLAWQVNPEDAQAQRDLSVSHNKLGDLYLRRGDSRAALDSYRSCHAILERLAGADPSDARAQHDLSISHDRLGDVYLEQGDSRAALDSYREALNLRQRLADADKANARAQRDLSVSHNKLGDVHLRQGETQAALDSYNSGLELAQRLADADKDDAPAQRDLSVSHEKLGDAHLRRGEGQAALASYKKALEIDQRLADADKGNAQAQRDLFVSLIHFGDVSLQLGEHQAALDNYKRGREVARRLADADKDDAPAQRDLSVSYNKLGDAYLERGDNPAALDSYKKGLELRRRLADDDPSSAQAQRDLCVSYNDLVDVYLRLGDGPAALDSCKKGLEVARRLADADKQIGQAQRDLFGSYISLGDVSLRLGDGPAALDSYTKGLEVAQRLADADKTSTRAQTDLFISHWKLGQLHTTQFEYAEAAERFGKARAVLLPLDKAGQLSGQFKNAVPNMDQEIAFCLAAEQAIADPASAIGQREGLRVSVLTAAMNALATKQKQPAKAVAAANLLADNAKEPDDWYNAARGCALCVALADKLGTKEKYAARAVELLRQAVARGYKDAAHMKKDTDLDALRPRDDFQKLLADLEAATKPKDKKEP
jgi:tetratricopeptide (TPR) repeat protein/tRNA A-37 threonylcarbamoyl transferase component Bud32